MNLIRLIKLKKIDGYLDNLTEKERSFLFLFDDLKFDKNYFRHKETNFIIFYLNNENKHLYYSYRFISLNFDFIFNMNEHQLDSFITQLLRNRLNLNGFTASLINIL